MVALLAISLSCGNGDSDVGSQSETGSETEASSSLDLFLDDNGFESVNSMNETDETPLQLALNTENFAAAAILLENGANDEELFTLDTSRVGLFEVGINESDIPEIAAAYGNVTLEEVDLMLEGMSAPAVEITFPGEPSAGIVLEIEPDGPGNVYRIKVLSDRFRTVDGIGVSSTVADIREFFDFQEVYWGEGGNPFIFIEEIEAKSAER